MSSPAFATRPVFLSAGLLFAAASLALSTLETAWPVAAVQTPLDIASQCLALGVLAWQAALLLAARDNPGARWALVGLNAALTTLTLVALLQGVASVRGVGELLLDGACLLASALSWIGLAHPLSSRWYRQWREGVSRLPSAEQAAVLVRRRRHSYAYLTLAIVAMGFSLARGGPWLVGATSAVPLLAGAAYCFVRNTLELQRLR